MPWCEFQTLVELAKARNSIPLPKIIGSPGIALPPELDTLIAPNYQLAVPTRTIPEMEEDETERKGDAKNSKDNSTGAKDVSAPSQPTHLQKSDQDGHKVSFSLAGKRPKS